MKTYAVIPLSKTPADFVERAKSIDPNAYVSYEPIAVFVRINADPHYIARKMGIITKDDNDKGYDGVVIQCRRAELSGYANASLWEFIRND